LISKIIYKVKYNLRENSQDLVANNSFGSKWTNSSIDTSKWIYDLKPGNK